MQFLADLIEARGFQVPRFAAYTHRYTYLWTHLDVADQMKVEKNCQSLYGKEPGYRAGVGLGRKHVSGLTVGFAHSILNFFHSFPLNI